MDETRQEQLRLRDAQRRVFERLEEIQRTASEALSAAQSAARDAGRLEKRLLNGGSGEIQVIHAMVKALSEKYDNRLMGLEKLTYMALGVGAVLPIVLTALALLINLGWLNGPQK